jgi:hypothetical protein
MFVGAEKLSYLYDRPIFRTGGVILRMRMSDSLCTLAAIYNKHIKFNGVSHRNVIDDGGDKQHRKQKLCPATLICLCENSPRCHSCVPKCELASRNDRLI